MAELTRPERAAEIGIARRKLAKILREGTMCSYCLHRDPQPIFGRSVCQTFGRAYPLCTSTPGRQFDPDHETLKGVIHAPSE